MCYRSWKKWKQCVSMSYLNKNKIYKTIMTFYIIKTKLLHHHSALRDTCQPISLELLVMKQLHMIFAICYAFRVWQTSTKEQDSAGSSRQQHTASWHKLGKSITSADKGSVACAHDDRVVAYFHRMKTGLGRSAHWETLHSVHVAVSLWI